MTHDFDVIVIGGGSAGFAAAGRAVESGAKTAVVEADKLGGDCPHRACVPTKILLRSAQILEMTRRAETFGVQAERVTFDLKRIMARKNAIVEQLTGDRLRRVLDKRGISLFTGQAAFKSNFELEIDGKTVSAAKFIIATGSVPRVPPINGLSDAGFITSNEAVNLTELSDSIAILGGGPVGVEFAEIFSRFGVRTTLIEATDRLLGHEDVEISELLRAYLKEDGIEAITGADIESVERRDGRKVVRLKGAPAVVADEIMVATGRSPAIDGLEPAAAGIESDEHGIVVDEALKTTAPNVWACGDVTGKLLYTHVAVYEGDLAGFNAVAPRPDRADLSVVPHVTFCDPEVAGVGLTEAQARHHGADILIGRMPLRYLGKSLITGERRGLVKLVANGRDRRLLGGHIIGDTAGELIHEIAVSLRNGLTVDSLAETIHAYPSMAEGIEAAAAELEAKEGLSHEDRAA